MSWVMVTNPTTTSEKAERFQYKKSTCRWILSWDHNLKPLLLNERTLIGRKVPCRRTTYGGITEAGFEGYPTWTVASATVLDMRGSFAPHDILSQLQKPSAP